MLQTFFESTFCGPFSQDIHKSRNKLPGGWLTQKTARIHQSIELSFSVVAIPDKALEPLSDRQEGKGQLLQLPEQTISTGECCGLTV